MLRYLIAAIAVVAVTQTASAQNGGGNPQQSIQGFNMQVLQGIANGMRYRSEIVTANDGTQGLRVMSPGNVSMTLVPAACRTGRCQGLSIFAQVPGLEGAPALNLVNTVNSRFNFAKMFTSGDQTLVMRYITADYGVPLGNVVVNIASLEQVARRMPQVLAQIAQPPQQGDPGGQGVGTSASTVLGAAFIEGGFGFADGAGFEPMDPDAVDSFLALEDPDRHADQ